MVQCLKCGYKWKPRSKERPKSCPECKSRRWDGKNARKKFIDPKTGRII